VGSAGLPPPDRLTSCRVEVRVEVRHVQPFEEEDVPLFTVGQVAEMLQLKQAFLRRVDQLQVVSPQRSNGGQRRYTRIEIRVIQQVASMADEGMTMPAIRRIIELEQQLAEVARQRDELAARLSEASEERARLTQQLTFLLAKVSRDRPEDSN
jgi:MerR family transcriptional regulator/heat shock protein HspR